MLLLVEAACGGEDVHPLTPDAGGPQFVSGCDDPMLWTVAARQQAEVEAATGGGPCSPAQYPLQHATLHWYAGPRDAAEWAHLDRTCWRVVEAAQNSGWTVGQRFAGTRDYTSMNLTGFARPVTVEGRVLRDDGTVAYAIPPTAVALDEARVLAENANDIVAVISADAWATRDAVHLKGRTVVTDEVVAATGSYGQQVVAVHRTAAGFVRRVWELDNGELVHSELALGPGTRARIARFGAAIVIDSELLMIGNANGAAVVQQRIPLASEPLEIAGTWYSVFLHLEGELVMHTHAGATASLPVDDGVLLPTSQLTRDAPMFFSGTTFYLLEASNTALGFDARSFAPRPDDLAAIGAPLAIMHEVVFGERGLLLLAPEATSYTSGPTFASYTDLFGQADGEPHLGPVAVDSSAYVITREGGNAQLFEAPFVDWCE